MPARRLILTLPWMAVLAWGCSKPDAGGEAPKPRAPAAAPTTAVVMPSPGKRDAVATEKSAAKKTAVEFVAPFPENANYFSPPKVAPPVVNNAPEPLARASAPAAPAPVASAPAETKPPRPELRVVGFVNVEGQKALLSVGGTLKAAKIGDSVENVDVLDIEPPLVTCKFCDEEFTLSLFGSNDGPASAKTAPRPAASPLTAGLAPRPGAASAIPLPGVSTPFAPSVGAPPLVENQSGGPGTSRQAPPPASEQPVGPPALPELPSSGLTSTVPSLPALPGTASEVGLPSPPTLQ